VNEPTAGERTLATRSGLDAAVVAAARDALNTIASLPWPRPERVSLLARLARAAGADVGKVLGGLALDSAPLAGLEALLSVPGLGYKRVVGLARALSGFDLTTLSSEGVRLRDAWATTAVLRAENEALRAELDRLRVRPPAEGGDVRPPSGASVMRIGDVASSVGSQVTLVDDLLRSRPNGLRLGGVDLRLSGAGTAFEGDVALDLGSPAGGSAVGLSFVPGGSEARPAAEAQVPDVSGYTTALAQRKLVARGFAVAFASVAGARGVVSEQSPPPSTLAPTGSVVRLIVR
jgi:hypothetical protein